jgi:hypothetical protein
MAIRRMICEGGSCNSNVYYGSIYMPYLLMHRLCSYGKQIQDLHISPFLFFSFLFFNSEKIPKIHHFFQFCLLCLKVSHVATKFLKFLMVSSITCPPFSFSFFFFIDRNLAGEFLLKQIFSKYT